MIDASVIISYIKSEKTLPVLLAKLEEQDYPRDRFEIILVNGDDYTPRASQAKGQIIGIEKSKGRILFFIDADRRPFGNDWISSHMRYYPRYDLVAGNVVHHKTPSLQALTFGNISMKREVLESIPINDIVSQQDADFAFRFIKQTKFKGILGGSLVWEEEDAKPSWRHDFLCAQNIMVLRRTYKIAPPLSDFEYRLRHPATFAGAISGLLFARKIVNAHV